MPGVLSSLLGSSSPTLFQTLAPSSGFGGNLRSLLDPEIALPMAGAMIAGQTPGESFGNAFMLAGKGIGERRKRNKTLEFLKKNRPDLLEAVEAGAPLGEVWGSVLGGGKSSLINVGGGYLYDPASGEWISSPGAGQERMDVPTSIQEFERAQADPEFKKWMTTGKGRDSSLMAGDRQAVRESEDMAMAANNTVDMLKSVIAAPVGGKSLNDRAGSGSWASTQAWLARNDPTGMFDDATGEATTELNNVVMGQALASLKSIFGAAPTEGERQILIDMQASVDKTPAERKIIMQRAIQLAEKRRAFYMDRANELRGGTYYQPGGGLGDDYKSRYGLE